MTVRGGWFAALLAGLLLAACAPSGPDPGAVISWRDLTIDLPDPWVEIQRTESSLMVANAAGDRDAGLRGDMEVATQFHVDPGVTPDSWRAFVDSEDGTIELDEPFEVDGVPATLIQYRFTTGGQPLLERVIVVPSRDLAILQQPTPQAGEMDGPDWFEARLDELDAVLAGITFGPPEGSLDG